MLVWEEGFTDLGELQRVVENLKKNGFLLVGGDFIPRVAIGLFGCLMSIYCMAVSGDRTWRSCHRSMKRVGGS